jgi:hypothetical protein
MESLDSSMIDPCYNYHLVPQRLNFHKIHDIAVSGLRWIQEVVRELILRCHYDYAHSKATSKLRQRGHDFDANHCTRIDLLAYVVEYTSSKKK